MPKCAADHNQHSRIASADQIETEKFTFQLQRYFSIRQRRYYPRRESQVEKRIQLDKALLP